MPKPTLKQKLLRQPTRSYAEALYEDEHTSNEPYWVTTKRHSRAMIAAGHLASTSTLLSSDSVPVRSSASRSTHRHSAATSLAHVRWENKAREENVADQAAPRVPSPSSSKAGPSNSSRMIMDNSPPHITNHIQPRHLLYNDSIHSPTPSAAHPPQPSSSSSQRASVVWSSLSVEPKIAPKHRLRESRGRGQEERSGIDLDVEQGNGNGETELTDDATSSHYYTPVTSPGDLPELDASASPAEGIFPPAAQVPAPLPLTHKPFPRLAASPSSPLHMIPAPPPIRISRANTSQSMASLPTTTSSRTLATTASASTEGDEEDMAFWASRSRLSLMTPCTSPPSSVYALSQSLSSTSLPSCNNNQNVTTKVDAIESKLVLPSQFIAEKRASLYGQAPSHSTTIALSVPQLAAPQPSKPRPESWVKDAQWQTAASNTSTRSSWTPPSPAPTPSPSPTPPSRTPPSRTPPASRPLSTPSFTSNIISSSTQKRARTQSTPDLSAVVPIDPSLLNGPSATIGIPFAHPETGLPIMTSIIAVSRQSMGNTTGTATPTVYGGEAPSTGDSLRRSVSLKSTRDRRASWRSSVSSTRSNYEDALENLEDVDDLEATPASSSASLYRRNTVSAGITSPPVTGGGGGGRKSHSRMSSTGGPRTIRGQMSFILEEDESGSGSPVMANIGSGGNVVRPSDVRYSGLNSDRRRARTSSLPAASASSFLSAPRLPRRSRTPSSITSASALSSRSSSASSSTLRRPSSTISNPFRAPSRTVDLPYPLPASHSSNGQPNASGVSYSTTYGGLILARAAFKPSKNPNRVSSAIDITKSGLAQTTMGTIQIVRGAAAAASHHGRHRHGLGLLGGKFGGSVASLLLLKGGYGTKEAKTPRHLQMRELADSTPLAFASRVSPPSRLAPNQVLVQVFMVALDGLDALVVHDKAGYLHSGNGGNGSGEGEYGFVPGRSFVGRAVESGFEVRNCCKGDWVYGLLDLTKCGALAEFIIVDRRRVCRALSTSHSALTLEQIALLPLCGVPARRAIRTLPSVGPGKTALVLNAHDGVGALIVQSLASQGVQVTAHIPATSPVDSASASSSARTQVHRKHHDDDGDNDGSDDDESQSQESGSKSSLTEVATPSLDERVRLLGASHVMQGEPLVVIAEMGAGSFDYVLDTVGGRRIWDASRWILKPSGQFTTLVGDKGAEYPAYEGNSLKSSMRSIRSAMRRSTPAAGKGKGMGRRHGKENGEGVNEDVRANGKSKGCGYEWVMPNAGLDTEGEDVRDTLAAVATLAEQGLMVPWPKQAIPFEQTPEAFVESRGLLENGGVVVSKLIDS